MAYWGAYSTFKVDQAQLITSSPVSGDRGKSEIWDKTVRKN